MKLQKKKTKQLTDREPIKRCHLDPIQPVKLPIHAIKYALCDKTV